MLAGSSRCNHLRAALNQCQRGHLADALVGAGDQCRSAHSPLAICLCRAQRSSLLRYVLQSAPAVVIRSIGEKVVSNPIAAWK